MPPVPTCTKPSCGWCARPAGLNRAVALPEAGGRLRAAFCETPTALTHLPSPSLIKRTSDSQLATIQYVRVDHRRSNILVPQEPLHSSNIVALLEQLRRKAMTKDEHSLCPLRPRNYWVPSD